MRLFNQMMIGLVSCVLARRGRLSRGKKDTPKKVMRIFSEYLDDKLLIDEREEIFHSERQRRLIILRNSFIKSHYSNITSVPDDLMTWFKQTKTNKFVRNCGKRSLAECSTFIPLEQIWNYGCWCFFGEEANVKGHGPIVNL